MLFLKVSLFLFLGAGAFAADKSKPETPDMSAKAEAVRPIMHEILANMHALRPYMVSKEKFEDPKNDKVIRDHLKNLSKLIKKAKHKEIIKSPMLSLSQKALEDHFSEVLSVFKVGSKPYARWALNSTFPICMSCHTQTALGPKDPWKLDGLKDYGSVFEQAEFLFAGRDYENALKLYDQLIDGFPGNGATVSQVDTSAERKMAYYARIKRDWKEGITSLEKSLKNKELLEGTRRNLEAWAALFRMQQKVTLPDPKTATDAQIEAYVEKELKNGLWDKMQEASNPRLVTNLTVSGILYEYLSLHPTTPYKPNILYWLGRLDREINDNFFYSLADLYLKECVYHYFKNPIAKECFKEYKTNKIFGYSGSGGTHLPLGVRSELDEMKELVEKGEKVKSK